MENLRNEVIEFFKANRNINTNSTDTLAIFEDGEFRATLGSLANAKHNVKIPSDLDEWTDYEIENYVEYQAFYSDED